MKLDATDRELDFAVPTGNFGNIFAGYGAKRMGLPIRKLIVGTNRNDVLPRFLDSGRMEKIGVSATISPSMDIQIPSNFERFLFDLMDRDGAVAETMRKFHDGGHFGIAADRPNAPAVFSSAIAWTTTRPWPSSAISDDNRAFWWTRTAP